MIRLAARTALLPDGRLEPVELELDGGRIVSVGAPAGGAPEAILAPGFVDLQVNGHDDVDVAAAAGSDWDRLDQILLAQGVTAWCPTLVSSAPGAYPPSLQRIGQAAERTGPRPAILGAHLEGPFLGSRPGAHDPAHLRPVEPEWLRRLPRTVRIVTLAPELDGALAAISALRARGILPALGHSSASYEQAEAAAAAGAGLVTHLFNAMTPLHHREPGLVGAALTDPALLPSLIADGFHVHPAVLLAAFRARSGLMGAGHPGVALVTDAVAADLGGVGRLRRDDGDVARRADGTMAGSLLKMDRAVANVVAAGVPLAAALAAASRAPAAVLGEAGRGRLEVGARADLVVLSPDLELRSTWVGGSEAWSA